MIISFGANEDGTHLLVIALAPADLVAVAMAVGEIDLKQIPEAAPYHGLRIILTGPQGGEALLKSAVESRDAGKDVRYRGRPGIPDE